MTTARIHERASWIVAELNRTWKSMWWIVGPYINGNPRAASIWIQTEEEGKSTAIQSKTAKDRRRLWFAFAVLGT